MNLNKLQKILTDLIARGFWGKITISFEKGQVVNVKKEENIK
jgi:hypothetical protein